MVVHVTLRYLTGVPVTKTSEREVPAGCTAGALRDAVIREEEEKEDILFAETSILMLVNGTVATDGKVLEDGDEVRILPVASGG